MQHNFLITAIFLLFNNLLIGQNVQWAHKIKDFSSDLGGKQYSVFQVLGKPDAMPQGGKNACAWLTKNANSPSEFVLVTFKDPMQIKQVAIFENYNPGTIKTVFLINDKGKAIKVHKGVLGETGKKTRVLRVMTPLTEYKVYSVKIIMNCAVVPGPNQIDAIGISDSEQPIEAAINIIPGINLIHQPENLGKNINSIYSAINPVITPDGRGLYFNYKNHPENTPATYINDDIWYAELDENNQWTPAINVGPPLNNKHHNFVCSVTPDGNTMLLANCYFKDGSVKEGASMSYKQKDGWSFPENLQIENFKNVNDYVGFFLSNDGNVLLMSIENDISYGGRDIYVSFHKDGLNWTEPKNLGQGINSVSDDITPFLAADGATLYFSTNGRSSFGSNDIFFSKRLDDTWEKWSEPINLGKGINTSYWDAYYTITASGDYAYFSSTKNSYGQEDIFRIKLPEEVKPDPVVLISGKVYNNKTKQPLLASIIYEVLPEGIEAGTARSDPETGEYKIVLPYGKKYGFRANAKGFYPISKNLDVSDLKKYTEIEKDLFLAPVEVGQVIRLNNIFFEFGKAALKEDSYPELNRVVTFLNDNAAIEIEISGHTDNVGSEAANLRLSQSRAESVVYYITAQGISASRLKATGFGESKPTSDNESEEGRAMNRRVEFTILK